MIAEDEDGEPPAAPEPATDRSAGQAPEAVVAAGLRAGKSLRGIAVDLYGARRVGAEWHADSCMRARLRRLVRRARAAAKAGSVGG